MTKNKVNSSITALASICLIGIAVLLENISVNQSSTLEQMLSKQDVAQINHYREVFGVESELVIVAIEAPMQLSTARIADIEALLLSIPTVSNALSSASVGKFGAGESQVFSPNENTELIVLMISPDSQQLAEAKQLSQQIRQMIDKQLQPGESSFVSGLPQVRVASWEISRSDGLIVLPLLVAITLVVTLIFFKSYTALALSLLLTSLTTFICLALQLMVRAELSALMILVVPVIWAISTLDAFHLYSRTAIKTRQHHRYPAQAASKELFIPCLLTTTTTAGCFLTLTLLDTSPLIISVGLWGAVGAIIAFILTFTLGKRMLSMQAINVATPRWPSLFALSMTRKAQQHSSVTIVAWGVLALAALSSLPNIKVATSFPQVFTADNRIAEHIDRVKALTGSDLNAIDVIVESSDIHGEIDANMASATLLTNNYLNTIDETQLVLPIGLMDEELLRQAYKKWQADRSPSAVTPANTITGLDNWVNTKNHAVRLQVHLADTSHKRKEEIVSWLVNFDETMLSHHKITLSGSGYYHYLTEKRGLASLLYSSILSLVIIALAILWITRDKIHAIIAMCGSVIPGIILAGCMAAFSIPWSIAMLPMPAVLLGLMNDDTIHILWSSQTNRRFGNHYFRRNALSAGPALLATTLVLSGAIGTMVFSGIQTNQYLGFLIPAGLMLALLCNLTLLPALSSLLHKSLQVKY